MQFDSFEQAGLKTELIDGKEKLSTLHKGFESRLTPAYENFLSVNETAQEGIALWIGENAALSQQFVPGAMEAIKTMYSGMDIDGVKTLGIKEISEWNIHPDYKMQCIKQHAGDAAAVISTVKDNLLALKDGTGITTMRVADRLYLLPVNDQYADKIRFNSSGDIVERIKTKFVGKDAIGCLDKLKSRKFDKVIIKDSVDKVEIPKDYYDDIKTMITTQKSGLQKQIERLILDGKEEALLSKQKELERIIKVDEKLAKSSISTAEVVRAVIDPEEYINRIYDLKVKVTASEAGIETGMATAALSCAVSTVDNVQKYFKGEVTAQEAVIDIAKDTGGAAAAGYGAGFIMTTAANAMRDSSHTLIELVSIGYVPTSVVSWSVQSFDLITEYAKGDMTSDELAFELGKNAAYTAGGVIGGVAAGTAMGSVVPGAGTLVGGFLGGIVGCAVASEAYVTAVEYGEAGAKVLASKAQELATDAVEIAKAEVPDKVNSIRDAINGFATENDVPIRV